MSGYDKKQVQAEYVRHDKLRGEKLPHYSGNLYFYWGINAVEKLLGRIGAVWGVMGVCLLLSWAVVRLGAYALESWAMSWHWGHWLVFTGWMVFMLYSEGYRGFQQNFSPRVVVRAAYLARNPVWWHVLLAPLYCMGFIHATRKRRIVAFSLTGGIILLVVLVHLLPQPWKGIVDAGVVAGLSWGVAAIVLYAAAALTGKTINQSPDVPEATPAA